MKGVVYTILKGDQVEKIDLEVIGVLHNAVGPKVDVILVRLLGDKSQKSGVVAGMSGSPVYFDGKLAGALALKLGTFTKEAIGGVTPIEDMLEVEKSPAAPTTASAAMPAARRSCPANLRPARRSAPDNFWSPSKRRWSLPACIPKRWRASARISRPGA